MPDGETLRAAQRAHWDDEAEPWNPIDGVDLVSRTLIDIAAIHPGDRVIDLACGNGNPAFAIADTVGPQGYVLGLDLSPRMIASATRAAQSCAAAHVEFRVIYRETDLGVQAHSFHAATCRHGLAWMPHPLGALQALSGAVHSGGRVAISTWGDVHSIPLLTVQHEILGIEARGGRRDTGEVLPHPLIRPDDLSTLLQDAGLEPLEVRTVDMPVLVAETATAYWDMAIVEEEAVYRRWLELDGVTRRAYTAAGVRRIRELVPVGPIELRLPMLVAAGRVG